MGSKTSKVAGSTANVINTVEIVDHQDDIQDVKKTIGAAPTSPSSSIGTDVRRSGTRIRCMHTYISIQR